MKAYQIQAFGFENLKLVDVAEPQPGPGEVLLKMRAWSLNFRDLMMAKGQYNPKLKMPAVPLSDGVGEVVELGPGVSRLKVGDRVAGCFMPKWIAGEIDDEQGRSALGGGGARACWPSSSPSAKRAWCTCPQHLERRGGGHAALRRGDGLARAGVRGTRQEPATPCWCKEPAACRSSRCSSPGCTARG